MATSPTPDLGYSWPAISAAIAFTSMLVTVTFSTWNVLGRWISSWFLKADLHLGVGELAVHSSMHEETFFLRLPVRNRNARRPRVSATMVEVFIDSIVKESGNFDFTRSAYLPIRLNWCHDVGPVCDRVSKGSTRLLDLGQLISTIGRTGNHMADRIGTFLKDTNPIELVFSAEVSPIEEFRLLSGVYRVRFRITCDQVSTEQDLRITINPELLDLGLPMISYLKIEPC